jgi:phage tail-like protein
MANSNVYPLAKFHFKVEWGGARAGFQDVSGVEETTDVIEYREGTTNVYTKIKMPGLIKYGNVTLKRGIVTGDFDESNWFSATVGTTPVRRTVKIMMLDDTGSTVVTWTLQNAFPASYKFTELNAVGNEVAIETLELAHEGILRS